MNILVHNMIVADKDAEIKRLEARCKELEADVANLKCCGNCKNYAYDMEEDHYYCNKNIFNGNRHAGVCSNNWQSDGMTAEDRK